MPDDSVLKEFHQKNGDLFSAPEYRALTVARLSTDEITKDIKISDEDLKKTYEERTQELTLPERRDLVQVVFQEEARAKSFAEAVKNSRDLASTAREQKLTPIDLNKVDEKTILPELYTTIFALEERQISDPIKSGLGWHVVQLKKIHAGGKPAFDEIKDKLRETSQKEMSADVIAQLVNHLDDSLAASQPLEEVADSLKLRLIKVPAIDANGKQPDGKEAAELSDKKDILESAFGLVAGETSPVIDDKMGNYFVVRVDESTPAHVEDFDKVKNKVALAWKQKEQAVRAAKDSEDIAKSLREGASATTYASRRGVDVRLSKPISLLGDIDPQLPLEAMPKVLAMEKGDVITFPAPEKQYVLRLADVISVDPAKPDEGRLKVVEDLNDKMAYELIEAYSKFLRQRYPVKINQELLDSLKRRGT